MAIPILTIHSKNLLTRNSLAHLVLVDNPQHNPNGDFTLKKGQIGNAFEGRSTFAGIAAYQKTFFYDLSIAKQALAPLLREAADEQTVTGELYQGQWTDVGTVERWQSLG